MVAGENLCDGLPFRVYEVFQGIGVNANSISSLLIWPIASSSFQRIERGNGKVLRACRNVRTPNVRVDFKGRAATFTAMRGMNCCRADGSTNRRYFRKLLVRDCRKWKTYSRPRISSVVSKWACRNLLLVR